MKIKNFEYKILCTHDSVYIYTVYVYMYQNSALHFPAGHQIMFL